MVFRKYKPAKQWGKMDTRIFKEMLNARNNRKMPSFQIPEAVKVNIIFSFIFKYCDFSRFWV